MAEKHYAIVADLDAPLDVVALSPPNERHSIMRKLRISTLCVFLGLFPVSDAKGDQTIILKRALQSMERSGDCYDNLQAEWDETRTENGIEVHLLHRLWSRDGKYFRFDSEKVDGDPSAANFHSRRLIVHPDRFIKTPGRSPFVADFGRTMPDRDLLYPNLLFKAN